MASGTTYQSLERLTKMPERSGEQGDRIAGQYYYDVDFTGGIISGVNLINVTGGSRTIKEINNMSSAPITYTLPVLETTQSVVIKDIGANRAGNFSTYNVTIVAPNGLLIDGAASYVMAYNQMATEFYFDGTGIAVLNTGATNPPPPNNVLTTESGVIIQTQSGSSIATNP